MVLVPRLKNCRKKFPSPLRRGARGEVFKDTRGEIVMEARSEIFTEYKKNNNFTYLAMDARK